MRETIFTTGSILHILLGQLNFEFIDWKKLWSSAKYVSVGNSFYDQTELIVNQENLGLPYQMPLMVYFLSIFAVYNSQRMARFSMSLGIIASGFLIKNIVSEEYGTRAAFIFFFNPLLIYISYQGYFESVVLFFTLFSAYSLHKGRNIFGGISIGVAVLLKIYAVILVVIFAGIFLRHKKTQPFNRFLLGVLTILGPIGGYFLIFYRDQFLLKSLGYHLSREEVTLSVFSVFFRFVRETQSRNFVVYAMFLLVLGLIIVSSDIDSNIIWYKSSLSSISSFLILNPIILPHYLVWHIIFAIPLISLNSDLSNWKNRPLSYLGLYMIIFAYSINNYFWGKYGFKKENTALGLLTLRITSLISLMLTTLLFVNSIQKFDSSDRRSDSFIRI